MPGAELQYRLEDKMEVEFDVKITSGALYDYLLSHTYHSMSGLLGTMVGALLIVAFFMNMKPAFLIAGLVIILYLPWTLFIRSKQQYMANEAFKKPLHYRLTDEGIEVSQDETVQMQLWDDMYKAVSTSGSILVYTNKINACIFPKKDLGEKRAAVIEAISTHMPPNKVKIRGN